MPTIGNKIEVPEAPATVPVILPAVPSVPDAFSCPHAKQCWQREFSRWVATAIISALTAWAASGCMLRADTPAGTITIDARYPGPQTAAAIFGTHPATRPTTAASETSR